MRAYLVLHTALFSNALAKGDRRVWSLEVAGGQETTITRLGVRQTN
jgi:hypothetical protein